MSYLGFGGKAVHGVPDIGGLIPVGTRDCNENESRAASIKQALGDCNSTHGQLGVFDNPCGDYLRAAIINYAADDNFVYKSGIADSDHQHAGYPDFSFWPHHSSIFHQQMWWEWIKRAYDGGLRVMVALAVNNELLAEILNGTPPYDDKYVADRQIDEMVRFVNNHSSFMQVAYSAADVRKIVSNNKLAVVLGMEVDKLGNFGKPGVPTNEGAVRKEIQRLYSKGIRYVFPVHLIDNSFGGAAVYDSLFNIANQHANGYLFKVVTSPDPNVTYNATALSPVLGSENITIITLKAALTALGELPAPCVKFHDPSCFLHPPGKIKCCGNYQKVLDTLTATPEWEAYKIIPPGHVNSLGLTPLGEVAINEMMKLGMIIDVDHMSQRCATRVIEIAERFSGGYPLVMGHNNLRGPNAKERSAPPALVRRIAALGGMFGVGTSNITASAFIDSYHAVWEAMGKRAVGIGTDVDGFERLPTHAKSVTQEASDAFYARFLSESGIITKQKTGSRTWDYVLDSGVSHYGLMPEFLFDVKTSTNGVEVFDHLMRSAEHFARMWEKCEGKRTIPGLRAVEVFTSWDDDPDPRERPRDR
jgi:microsomal dipeptidase-like Zn-dependent dipeptidase